MPMALNMIFPGDPMNVLAGGVGQQLNVWLIPVLGKIGLIFLLIFIPAIFVLIDFNFSFKGFKFSFKKDVNLAEQTPTRSPKEDIYNTVEFSVDDETGEVDYSESNNNKKENPISTGKP